jgi:DNA-binding response OmpR family regulator
MLDRDGFVSSWNVGAQRILGYRADDVLRSAQPLDLVIADIGLPGLDGRMMMENAPPHRNDLRVLYTTGYTDIWVLQHGEPLRKRSDMLTKPFHMGALLTKIDGLARIG